MNKKMNILPVVGMGMAAAALGVSMMKLGRKNTVQSAAGKAIKAVGEVVENFSAMMKN